MNGKVKRIQVRGDDFYYIEVWDKTARRSKTIDDILGNENPTKPKYLTGGRQTPRLKDKVYLGLFWKRLESAEHRIETIYRLKLLTNMEFTIRKVNRKEFIKLIPSKIEIGKGNLTDTAYWYKNYQLKQMERRYMSKIKEMKKPLQESS